MAINDEQIDRLIRAVRLIAHGEEEPAGLEMLAMAFSKKDEPSISCAIDLLSDNIHEVAGALHRIADGIGRHE